MSQDQNNLPDPLPPSGPLDTSSPQATAVVVPPLPRAGEVPVLQKLSSPPFPRSGFPLLGILASVYEHVIAVAGRSRPASAAPAERTAEPAQHL